MSIFDDELVYAAFLKRDVDARGRSLTSCGLPTPTDAKDFTITSVGTAAPSPTLVTSLDSSAPSTTPPPLRPIATTSSDINSLISTPTVEPLEPVQAAPARCSTEGRSHDEQAQVLVVAAPTSPPVPLQDVQPLHDDMTAITSKPSPTCIHAQVVFDDMQQKSNTSRSYYFEDSQQRYIHSCKPAYSNDVVFPWLATRVWSVHKLEGMNLPYSVLLQPSYATVVDRGSESYICNVEGVCIHPKPPWSIVCLAPIQFWLQSSFGWVTGYQKPQWPPPIQWEMQTDGIHLRPTPWPSFDFLTSVHLEKALLSSWHSFQLVKLSLCDGSLLQLAPESFLLVAQLLISKQVGLVIGTTKVQALGCSSHSRAGIAEFFLCQCELTVARISSQRNGLQYLQILVQLQQHLNYQPVIMWDPGADQHFMGGCKSLDYWLNLDLRQIIWYCVKKSKSLYLQILKHKVYQYLAISNRRSPSVHPLEAWSDVDHRRPDNGGRIMNLAWFSSKQVLICVVVSPDFQNNVIFSHQWAWQLSCLQPEAENDNWPYKLALAKQTEYSVHLKHKKVILEPLVFVLEWIACALFSANEKIKRKTKSLLDGEYISHFKHEDHICAFCPWELHQLSDKAWNGQLTTQQLSTTVNILTSSKDVEIHQKTCIALILRCPSEQSDLLAYSGRVTCILPLSQLAAYPKEHLKLQVVSNCFALCNDCQIKSDIYMDWWIFSICALCNLEINLLPGTAKHGQFSTKQLSTPINNSTTSEYAKQLKGDGTVPLVLAPTVVTFHKAVYSMTILEISEQVADSSSISGSEHNNTIPAQLKCGERLHTQPHYNYEIVTAVMQLGVSGSMISKAREEVPFMVVCNCPEFNKPNTSHFCSGREMVMQTFGMHMLDHLPVVGNVMSHLVQIVSLPVINTATEQCHLLPFRWLCFNSGALEQSRPLQSGGNQGSLYSKTTEVAMSENNSELHTNSVRALRMQWCLYPCYALLPQYLIHCGESTDDTLPLELSIKQMNKASGNSPTRGGRLQVADSLILKLRFYGEMIDDP